MMYDILQTDTRQSYYVGDAAGRPTDFKDKDGNPASTDKEFAEALGLEFKLPEELFG
jgi:hypothetical protein